MEGQSGARARGAGSDQDYGETFATTRKRGKARAQLRSSGICGAADRGGVAGVFEVDWAERGLDVEQGLVEVRDDVLDVFDADGETNQTFGDAHALADFHGHGGVGHQRRKRD